MITVWNKYWWHEQESRGVSRTFETVEEAKKWASENCGNWQFEEHSRDGWVRDADGTV